MHLVQVLFPAGTRSRLLGSGSREIELDVEVVAADLVGHPGELNDGFADVLGEPVDDQHEDRGDGRYQSQEGESQLGDEMVEKDAQLVQASKMTALGEMSSGVAHELNQPLNSIKMGSEFLRMMIEKEGAVPPDQLHTVVDEMSSQVDRASEIISTLREFGRKAELVEERLNINRPIRGVFALLGQQLSLQNIHVVLELDDALPPILAHNNKLQQVLFNLVTNARDAINQKRQTVGNAVLQTIRIRSFMENDRVAVSVSDSGTGIPEHIRDKIFEPFFTTKEAGQGMGLGLSITYGIVRDYGGDIEVRSEEDVGTTFKLTFPVHPVPAEESRRR